MNLDYKIEQQKKKSRLISDFVIDASYIKDLAPQVLNADEKMLQMPEYQEACRTLRLLCDTVESALKELQDFLPPETPPSKSKSKLQ